MKIRPGLLATVAAAAILISPAAAYATAVSVGGGGPGPYTTSTSLISETENPSDCTATPGATPVQIGQVVGIPCTYPITTTVVTSYTLHSPSPRYGQRPVIGYGPRPIVGYGPRPVVGHGPKPVIGYGPRPIVGYGPKPIVGYGPKPIIGYGPKPIVGYGPRPIVGYGPRPIVGYKTVQTGPYHRTMYHTETVRTKHTSRYSTYTCRDIDGRKDVICTFVWHTKVWYTTSTVQVPYTVTYYLTSQVPVYGAAPPIYGKAPPIYGKAKPIYGKAPPIYGKAPPIYGKAPPIYGKAPPIYGAAPPIYGPAPPIYGAAPIIGYNWTTSPDGTSTRTTTSYQQGLLFQTPLGRGGKSPPAHNGRWYVIPIDTSGN